MRKTIRIAYPLALICSIVVLAEGFLLAFSDIISAGETERDEYYALRKATPEWLLKPINADAGNVSSANAMKPYTEKLPHCSVKFDMIPIPGGKFTMGSPGYEEGREDDEGPQIEVEIEPFWMGRTEVTWGEFNQYYQELDKIERKRAEREPDAYDKIAEAIARPSPAYTDITDDMPESDEYPAICMSQYSAKLYCKWLSAKTGHYYRLPTEAEWEYACRARTRTAFSFGKSADDLEDYAWFYDNSEDGYSKVAQKKPNPWGLYDMHGNVSEWCLDQYDPDRYRKLKAGEVTDAFTPVTKRYPVVTRGGSWWDDPDRLRSAARDASNQDWNMDDPQVPQDICHEVCAQWVGFRVVRPLRIPSVEEAWKYEPAPEVYDEFMKPIDKDSSSDKKAG